jgi:hypothetical protein
MADEARTTVRVDGDSSSARTAVSALEKAFHDLWGRVSDAAKPTHAFGDALDGLIPKASEGKTKFGDLGTTLQTMWRDPIDGVKKLSTAFATDLASSLGTVGIAAGVVTGVIVGVTAAFVGTAAAAFGLAEKAAAVGAKLNDITDKVGGTVPMMSRLSNAMQVSGGSIETVSNAIFKFQVNVANSAGNVAKGLERIGLSFKEIDSLDQDKKFERIARAIAATEDPVKRNSAGMLIYGRSFRDMAPDVIKLGVALEKTAGIDVFTEKESRAAEAFEMEVRALKLQFESMALSIGKELIPIMTRYVQWARFMVIATKEIAVSMGPLHEAIELMRLAAAAHDLLRGKVEGPLDLKQMDALIASRAELNLAMHTNLKEIDDLAISESEEKRFIDETNDSIRKQTEARKKAADAAREQLDAWNALVAVFGDLDGAVEDQVRNWLALGKSQSDIAKAYGLTGAQVAAVAKQMEFEKSITDATTKSFGAQSQQLFVLTSRFGDLHDEIKGTSEDGVLLSRVISDDLGVAIPDLAQGYRMTTEEAKKTLHELREQKRFVPELGHVFKTLGTAVEGTFAQMMLGAKGFKDGFIDIWHSIKGAFTQILGEMLNYFLKSFILRMIGGAQGAGGMMGGLFGGGGGGAGGGGGGGGLGGIFGGLFGGGGGGGGGFVGPTQGGGGMFGGMANMGNMARFGGGGMLAVTGFMQLMQAQGKLANTLAGAQTGAGIGTMIAPGIGTAIGAGVGALAGFVKSLLGGASAQEKQGRDVVKEFEAQLAGVLTAQQKIEAGGEQWKMTVIAVRDAYLATGKSEKDAEAAVKSLWDSSTGGAEAVKAAILPILAALEKQKQLLGQTEDAGSDATDALADGFSDARQELDWLSRASGEWARNFKIDLEGVKEGVDAVSFGESPGGLVEWARLLVSAQSAFSKTKDVAVSEMSSIKRVVDQVGVTGGIAAGDKNSFGEKLANARHRNAPEVSGDTYHLDIEVMDATGLQHAVETKILPMMIGAVGRNRRQVKTDLQQALK